MKRGAGSIRQNFAVLILRVDDESGSTRIDPLIEVGFLELNQNPENYFAEVEQSAFNPANVVPGIGFSLDRKDRGPLESSRKHRHYSQPGKPRGEGPTLKEHRPHPGRCAPGDQDPAHQQLPLGRSGLWPRGSRGPGHPLKRSPQISLTRPHDILPFKRLPEHPTVGNP